MRCGISAHLARSIFTSLELVPFALPNHSADSLHFSSAMKKYLLYFVSAVVVANAFAIKVPPPMTKQEETQQEAFENQNEHPVTPADLWQGPHGQCAGGTLLGEIQRWCNKEDENLTDKRLARCPTVALQEDFDYVNEVYEHRFRGNPRRPFEGVHLSCNFFCQNRVGINASDVQSFYAYNGEPFFRDGTTAASIYCDCGKSDTFKNGPPPTVEGYLERLALAGKWEELRMYNYQCSGRGHLAVKFWNRHLKGNRCNSFGADKRMVCMKGFIDHCEQFRFEPTAEWTHKCEAIREGTVPYWRIGQMKERGDGAHILYRVRKDQVPVGVSTPEQMLLHEANLKEKAKKRAKTR